MPLYLSTRSLSAPTDLAGVLDLFRMARIERVALEDGPVLGPDDARRLEGFALSAHGVFLPSEELHGPNLAAGDEDFRRRSVRRLEAHLAFCADRGLSRYTFMAGSALEETFAPDAASRPISRARAIDQLLKSLDRLATVADDYGVAIGLMNGESRRPEQLGCDAPELMGILDALQVPFLGIRLDVAHLALSAERRRLDPAAFIARLGDRLVGLRLHEVSRAGVAHQLPAADGPTEELLAGHPEWHGLPMSLDARGVGLDRLLDAKERLEARLAAPSYGPATRPGK